jgi:arsenite oxidase small subunit
MSDDPEFNRRGFVRLCVSAAALVGAVPALLAQSDAAVRRYQRVKLIDDRDRPIAAAHLKVGESYLFYYPYISTPCFLLNLGRATKDASLQTEDGRRYHWDGGVGARRSVVAFSAICAHKLSHPAREVSFINYRHEAASFHDSSDKETERAQVIYCCSEKSVYDPADGARVLGGPAKQPLTTIALEQDDEGTLFAIGTAGGELFDRFFERFSSRLALEFRTSDVRKVVTDTATVKPIATYCRNQILC